MVITPWNIPFRKFHAFNRIFLILITTIEAKEINNKKIGTIFHPVDKPVGNKKSWLSHAIKTVGQITLDEGACLAIEQKGASLLIVGVKKVEGDFTVNQAVRIVNTNKKEVAKGITSMSSDSLKRIINKKENINLSMIVVHRDVLALT